MTERQESPGPIWVDAYTRKSSQSSSGACVGLHDGPEGLALVDVVDMKVVPDVTVAVTLEGLREFIGDVKRGKFDFR